MERAEIVTDSGVTENIETIEISSIVETVRVRVKASRTTIEEYAAAMTAGAKFPPIVCYRDADGSLLLSDGAHRLSAVRKIGGTTIAARIMSGSKRDCLIHAVASASEFGLRFSTKDKRHQIELFISSYPKMKDREIGRAIGVDGKTVAAHRERLAAAPAEIPQATEPTEPDDRIVWKLQAQLEKTITMWPDSRHSALRSLLAQWSDALAPASVEAAQ